MSKFEKFERILRVALVVSAIFGAWALGLHQLTGYFDNLSHAQVRSAETACLQYELPHAIVAEDGKVYCYVIYYGSEQILRLEDLDKFFKDPKGGGYKKP